MLIALPNREKYVFTVILFMPFETFEKLSTPEVVVEFFGKHFPDALKLMGSDRLVRSFFKIKPSPLLSIKVEEAPKRIK